MKAKVFQAQALDNTSSDHLQLAESRSELSAQAREQAVAFVSSVSSGGSVLFSQDGVKLFANGNFAVLQVISEERDRLGRMAPVVCCLEHIQGEGSVEDVWGAMESFAQSIGRSFSDPKRLAAREALSMFAKKPQGRGCLALLLPGLGLSVVAMLIDLLTRLKVLGR